MVKKLKALIIGECLQLIFPFPSFLVRAGFEVDAISNNIILKKSRFISNFELVEGRDFLSLITKKELDDYDFIIPTDDLILSLIINSNLPVATKLKLLPVNSEENLKHIYSKIGLSLTLSEFGVKTPDFIVANGIEEVKKAAKKLQYPVMVKTNSDAGGVGVFECNNSYDVNKIDSSLFNSSLLVQKKIIGTELDLSGLYRNGELIYFTYSQIEKVAYNKFGPSSLRIYKQLSVIDKEIFSEMRNLGKALGANGFVTISCIEDKDKKRYFFEADMRPNAWVEFAKFIGDDPAFRVANWFRKSEEMKYPFYHNKKYPNQIIIPYFMRLTKLEILFNRYKVWKYLPFAEYKMLIELLYDKNKVKILFAKIRKYYRHPKLLFKDI